MSKDSDHSFSMPERVTAIQVQDEDRLNFLPDVFGDLLMLRGEALVYGWLRQLCAEYSGGFWQFYRLSNGGFYLAPERTDRLRLTVAGNYFDGVMSADAAGIVATLFALGQLAGETREERFIDAYHQLRAYACGHDEAASIFAAID